MKGHVRVVGVLAAGLIPLGAAWAEQAGTPGIPPEQVAELVRQTLIPDPLMRQQFLMILRGREFFFRPRQMSRLCRGRRW